MATWLNEQDVRAVLSPAELIGAIELALSDFSTGTVSQPVRTAIGIGEQSFFGVMPALYRAQDALGAKLVTVLPANSKRGLHTHQAVIVLFDPATGEPNAILDGRYITEVRTAAASAISTKHLARSDAEVLAILGTGVQAASHYDALSLVRRFHEVRAWSPTPGHRDRFAAERPGVRATDTAAEAVRDADVVVVATSSPTPAVANEWVADGAHVIAIGACRQTQRELDPALTARAALFVDSRAAALTESGDVVQGIAEGRWTEDHIRAELGEIVNGTRPGRRSASEVTLFKSLGLAVEDITAAALAWRRAQERGIGVRLI